jgi:pimeloyl-ACP methyl ester carboxylesterase
MTHGKAKKFQNGFSPLTLSVPWPPFHSRLAKGADVARFVLVHGAFTGAWIWSPLAERLRAAGHSVDVFDLPGLGDDATPPEDVSLDSCAARLGEVLATGVEPAIVAGNSLGGVIATQAAARHPQRVAALVYVTVFVPRDGQSLLDLTHLPEGADDQVQANIIVEPPVATMPAAASRNALYGSCSEADAAWAVSKQRPQPLGPFAAPVSIPTGALDGISRYFVLCTKDRAIPVALQRRMIAENAITNVVELDTDHTPHLSMTAALADALQQFARQAADTR